MNCESKLMIWILLAKCQKINSECFLDIINKGLKILIGVSNSTVTLGALV